MSSSEPHRPLYQTIARTIARRIATGQYQPGGRIPAIRRLAAEFGCNKLTVHKAFELLKQEGLIENRVGSGSFVRYPQQIHEPAGIFDFRTDYIADALFPFDAAQAIFTGLFNTHKAQSLAPAPAQGDPELIQTVSRHFQLPAQRLMMISGAQQGLDLVSKVFCTNVSESMLFEDPTYPGAISLFRARHFVPMQDDGPDMEYFDRALAGPVRLFYAMPAVHNPTGIGYSRTKKEGLARRARKHPFYIIEDDYLGEFTSRPLPRMVDLCPERTIYIQSLSQTTVAGIRLGFMVVPGDLYDKFVYAKFTSDIASFGLLQKFVNVFIREGHYQRFIETNRQRCRRRRRQLQALLSNFDLTCLPAHQIGFSLWVRSQRPMDISPPPWAKGEEFSFSPRYRSHFKIAFMNMDDETFPRGLGYLKTLLEPFQQDLP
jgi:2-aminoadipate transaminase